MFKKATQSQKDDMAEARSASRMVTTTLAIIALLAALAGSVASARGLSASLEDRVTGDPTARTSQAR